MQVQKNFTLKAPIRPQSAAPQQEAQKEANPGDSFTPSAPTSFAPSKPHFAKSSSAPKPAELTDNPEGDGIGGWKRAVLIGMTGVLGMGALTGCVPQEPGSSTSTETEAMKTFSSSLESIEKSMKENGDQSSGNVAGQVFNSIAEYSRATGEKGEELMGNLGKTIQKHPVLAASIAFAAGNAIGIGLDQFGVTDSAMETAGDVVDWVKENPWKSVGIGVAVAGAGYLLYDNVIKPMAEVPAAPTGEHAEQMEATFAELERQIQEEGAKPEDVSKTLVQKIQDYAKATGRSAQEVKNDLFAWSYEHPVLATSLVAGAGVGTGILLSKAGVPDYVASALGTVMESTGDGVEALTEYAKEHPIIAGTVAVGIAAGAGYLIYDAVQGQ